jgi:hypothetical protein
VVAGALYLACARLEADPGLRQDIVIVPGFRVLFVFHDEENDIDVSWRALATRHASGPATRFFEALGLSRSGR